MLIYLHTLLYKYNALITEFWYILYPIVSMYFQNGNRNLENTFICNLQFNHKNNTFMNTVLGLFFKNLLSSMFIPNQASFETLLIRIENALHFVVDLILFRLDMDILALISLYPMHQIWSQNKLVFKHDNLRIYSDEVKNLFKYMFSYTIMSVMFCFYLVPSFYIFSVIMEILLSHHANIHLIRFLTHYWKSTV